MSLMDFKCLFEMPDEILVQALHDKLTRTELLLISRSCSLRSKGKPTKLIFASEIVNDMRTIYAESMRVPVSDVYEQFLNRYEEAFKLLWSIRVRSKYAYNEYHRQRRVNDRAAEFASQQALDDSITSSWPEEISERVSCACFADCFTASEWKIPRTCACCSRSPRNLPVTPVHDVQYDTID